MAPTHPLVSHRAGHRRAGAPPPVRSGATRAPVTGPPTLRDRKDIGMPAEDRHGGLLADDLFWITHGDMSGQPQLHPRAMGLGLAAALLGELVLTGQLDIAEGVLSVLTPVSPAGAPAHPTLDQIMAEPRVRDVRSWLAFLGPHAEETVGQRLLRAGLVERHASRWRRSAVRWTPRDRLAAARPSGRLYLTLTRNEAMSITDAVLGGLVAAVGLTRTVLFDAGTNGASVHRLTAWVGALPLSLHELVAQTEAAVGALVLTHRA